MEKFIPLLTDALDKNKMMYTPQMLHLWAAYLVLLKRWSSVFNLTSVYDPLDMVNLHIIDSLLIQSFLHGKNIIDVGTGAGLPGIPLAIACPTLCFTLLDSNSKKTCFLTQVAAELALNNIEIIHARCEKFQPSTGFDSIVSRAFSSIGVMLTGTQHLLAEGGQFLAMKGVYPQEEIAQVTEKYQVKGVYPLTLHGLAIERHLVRISRN
jgi:16S rRNA (guanine527-N7)-methyltransferase